MSPPVQLLKTVRLLETLEYALHTSLIIIHIRLFNYKSISSLLRKSGEQVHVILPFFWGNSYLISNSGVPLPFTFAVEIFYSIQIFYTIQIFAMYKILVLLVGFAESYYLILVLIAEIYLQCIKYLYS